MVINNQRQIRGYETENIRSFNFNGHASDVFLVEYFSYSELCRGFDLFMMTELTELTKSIKNQGESYDNFKKIIQTQGDVINALTMQVNEIEQKYRNPGFHKRDPQEKKKSKGINVVVFNKKKSIEPDKR